jgi:predicted nuclease of predicted toxin-antitoxin system
MQFLVDECCGPVVARWLREQGHDVRRVADVSPGLDDANVLELAHGEDRVLITNDKGFGARVFEKGDPHSGVILLRLTDERPPVAIRVLSGVLRQLGTEIQGRFVVATERRVRPSRGRPKP